MSSFKWLIMVGLLVILIKKKHCCLIKAIDEPVFTDLGNLPEPRTPITPAEIIVQNTFNVITYCHH